MTWAGLIVSAAVAAVVLPPWSADMRASGLTRENWRGRTLAFPLGALAISASLIRDLLAGGHSVRYLLPDPVVDYIGKRSLYR